RVQSIDTSLPLVVSVLSHTATHSPSLHDAHPISTTSSVRAVSPAAASVVSRTNVIARTNSARTGAGSRGNIPRKSGRPPRPPPRSEEHTSELQSRFDLVCSLLLEKKQ